MLTAPVAKGILKHNPEIIPCIVQCSTHFEIVIDGDLVAPQRMTTPPQARQFKTLTAAYSYLRNFLEHKSDILIKRHDPELRYRHYS